MAERDALSQFEIDVAWCAEEVELSLWEIQVTMVRAESPRWSDTDSVLVASDGRVVKRPFECFIFREVLR